ncbi:MAG: isochorismatase family protein [Mycobacteriales bacterium]
MTAPAGAHRDGWRGLIPHSEWELYRKAGYGRPMPPGSRPALLVVDATFRFVGTDDAQDRSMLSYPTSTGSRAWRAVEQAEGLLWAFRRRSLPVYYSIRDQDPPVQAQLPRALKRAEGEEPANANEIVPPLAPIAGEAVIAKAKPSAFHSTTLLSMLIYRGVDTVVVVGGVTSGCVRASAVDAFSYGLRVVVAEDAVFDRSELSHATSLFDLEQKYAQVCPSDAALDYLGLSPTGDPQS